MRLFTRTAMLSFALACATGITGEPASANPVTVQYHCTPALPKGDTLTVDYNSGYKSVTVEFPSGQSVRMKRKVSASGFAFAKGKLELFGKGETDVSLQIAGQPLRRCVSK